MYIKDINSLYLKTTTQQKNRNQLSKPPKRKERYITGMGSGSPEIKLKLKSDANHTLGKRDG